VYFVKYTLKSTTMQNPNAHTKNLIIFWCWSSSSGICWTCGRWKKVHL